VTLARRASLRARAPAAAGAALAIVAGLAARYGLSGAWSKYLGVALWATVVYALVVLARPRVRLARAAAIAAAIGVGVELLQITPVPAWLSAQHIVLRLVFGIGYSPRDLPFDPLGAAIGAAAHALARHAARSRAPH
jgi:hypothetical protein